MSGSGVVRFAVAAVLLSTLVGAPGAAAAERDPLKPVWTSGLPGQDEFDVVVAPDRKNVWAFGMDRRERAIAYRKSGATWKPAGLPRGLKGSIVEASASSARNVWAVGYEDFNTAKPTYLLRWNGERWKVAKRWDAFLASAVATGSRGVWVFDEARPRALRFDGRRWRRVNSS